ncbi:hypothetical protein HAX54_022680 [Datura stramonium]|uniref:Uncharacterized protein n=1 Tax=Datura stramonium TaxID=4076 RepID=A0ABS8S7C7_DATST|nr:hypothetical protein [Datura stramonium]
MLYFLVHPLYTANFVAMFMDEIHSPANTYPVKWLCWFELVVLIEDFQEEGKGWREMEGRENLSRKGQGKAESTSVSTDFYTAFSFRHKFLITDTCIIMYKLHNYFLELLQG